jgi:hypothetical protein
VYEPKKKTGFKKMVTDIKRSVYKMNKSNITRCINTLHLLENSIITKHLKNHYINKSEEIQKDIKTICFYLEKIKKEI